MEVYFASACAKDEVPPICFSAKVKRAAILDSESKNIVDQHLTGGKIVEDLKIAENSLPPVLPATDQRQKP